jgi:hypothetical protein
LFQALQAFLQIDNDGKKVAESSPEDQTGKFQGQGAENGAEDRQQQGHGDSQGRLKGRLGAMLP